MIKTIFLDIDDTLNNFTLHALNWVGCKVPKHDWFDPEWGRDIVKAANYYHTSSFTEKEFWDSIPEECWATAPKTNYCSWLIGRCVQLVGKDNVCILTSPTLDPRCASGKMIWIQDHMPEFLQRQYLIGPPKQFCAHAGALLIDDADKNVELFREAGGESWIVPKPWNRSFGFDVELYLDTQFRNAK